MQVTAVQIYPNNEDEDLVRASATIVFDNCFMIREIKVIESTMAHCCSVSSGHFYFSSILIRTATEYQTNKMNGQIQT
jgi:SpoVG